MEWLSLARFTWPDGPAAESALADFLEGQQAPRPVARIALDMAVELAHRGAPALYGLQEDAPPP